jgi:hypothetical protein
MIRRTLSRTLSTYEQFAISRPWSTGFVTCAVKGLAADMLIQCAVEKKSSKDIDWKRAGTFSFYGGWYCGWFQHGLYNIVYHRIFGASTALSNAIRKVAFDSVFHVPFVIFPVYYVYKAWMLGGKFVRLCFECFLTLTLSALNQYTHYHLHTHIGQHGSTAWEGLALYGEEALSINARYFSVWIPANLLVFTVVPKHLRIAFIATTSFAWLSLVSFITLRTTTGPTITTTTTTTQFKDDEEEKKKHQ